MIITMRFDSETGDLDPMCPRDPDTNQVFDCGDNGHCWMQQCCCNLGYEGDNCETDIRECESNPCGEGATCVDEINFYTLTFDCFDADRENRGCRLDVTNSRP